MPRYKKRKFKKKFKRKTYKKKSRVPRAVYASETKIQKNIMDLTSNSAIGGAKLWTTPYQYNWVDHTGVFNPEVVTAAAGNPINQNIGSFIINGDRRDQRNGRRITMMSAKVEMVFNLNPIPNAVTGVYNYVSNPELRVIQGWCKGGIDSLKYLEDDINSMYGEIPYSRYKVMKDFILTRTGYSAMAGFDGPNSTYATPSLILNYKTIKLNFRWNPKRRLTFDNWASLPSGTTDTKYTGWIPFIYIFNPNSEQLNLEFRHFKRVNIFKDL